MHTTTRCHIDEFYKTYYSTTRKMSIQKNNKMETRNFRGTDYAGIDFKTKIVTDKEGCYIMTKGSIQQEDITIVHIYATKKEHLNI